VRVRQIQRGLGAVAAAATLGLAGCASSSVQTDAAAFVGEHATTAARAARAMRVVETDISRLSRPPRLAQLERLALAAGLARRRIVPASEWNIAKSGEGGEEGVEEEDLPRAETEATEAATELASAMSALQAYVRAPSASALARYRSKLAHGREVWDESISQLWFLAHKRPAPIV